MNVVVYDGAHVAVLHKGAGQQLDARSLPPLSREPGALAQPLFVSPLLRAHHVGGLVAAAKSRRAAALLERDASASPCIFSALLAGLTDAPSTDVAAGVEMQLLSSSSGVLRPRLSLVSLRAAADVSVAGLLRTLESRGLSVVGSPSLPAPGGIHLALTSLSLPSSLAELCPGADMSRPFAVEQPRKLAKTQRREALHAARRDSLSTSDSSTVEFCGLPFHLSAGQLAPRPSSEVLVHTAISVLNSIPGNRPPAVLDLGVGAGALLLSTMHARPGCTGVGLDIDAAALSNCALNAEELLGIDASDAARLTLLEADFGQLHLPEVRARLPAAGFDVLLCNPPYLRAGAVEGRSTVEAGRVLVGGGEDGLAAYSALAHSLSRCTPPLMRGEGRLVLQVPGGGRGAERVAALFPREEGWMVKEVVSDGRGVERCLVLAGISIQ